MKNLLNKTLILSALITAASTQAQDLLSTTEELIFANQINHYTCELSQQIKRTSVDVKIDLNTLLMEVTLDEGLIIRGYAVMTTDLSNGTQTYFLQGNTAPKSQQLSLVINSSSKKAHFTRTYGGAIFDCEEY